MISAIVIGRKGSKRIPRKNIKLFNGKPIFHYPLTILKNIKSIKQIYFSTDDEIIMNYIKKEQNIKLIKRPKKLCDNYSSTLDVMNYTINNLPQNDQSKYFICVYASSVFLTENLIKKSIRIIKKLNCEYVVPVKKYPHPIQRALKINGKYTKMVHQGKIFSRTQDLSNHYYDSGMFYLGKKSAWLKNIPIFQKKTFPFFISNLDSIDIDNPEDWFMAEKLYKFNYQNNENL